jgi:hypothetical protein
MLLQHSRNQVYLNPGREKLATVPAGGGGAAPAAGGGPAAPAAAAAASEKG